MQDRPRLLIFIVAYHANTGKEAWRFYTIPKPGEPLSQTWVGRALVTIGILILLFVAYQLWGTGLRTGAAQDDLVAFAQLERVVAAPTEDAVGRAAARNRVDAGAAEDQPGGRERRHRKCAGACLDPAERDPRTDRRLQRFRCYRNGGGACLRGRHRIGRREGDRRERDQREPEHQDAAQSHRLCPGERSKPRRRSRVGTRLGTHVGH